MMIENVPDLPIEEIRALCQRYGVRELALFGSALRQDFRADSDLDLLIDFEPNVQVGFLMLARVQRELTALLQRRVDLVPKSGLKPLLRQSVLESAQVIYAA